MAFQFRTCLGTLKIELTEQETQELIRRYQLTDGTGLIRYKEFIDKAEAVFSDSMNPSEAINASRSQGVSYSFGLTALNRCSQMKRECKCCR